MRGRQWYEGQGRGWRVGRMVVTICKFGARGVDSVTCILRGGNERVEKAGTRGGFYDSD